MVFPEGSDLSAENFDISFGNVKCINLDISNPQAVTCELEVPEVVPGNRRLLASAKVQAGP